MPPVLTSVSVDHGTEGTPVSLFGTSLNTVTQVKFGEVPTPFTIVSSTQIDTSVPVMVIEAATVSVTDGAAVSSHAFTVLFAGPWIHQPARSTVAASENSGPTDYINAVQTYGAENTTDDGAAIVNHGSPITLMASTLVLDGAVLGGWRYGTGLNEASVGSPVVARWYDYQQWEGEVGWSLSDLEVVDDTSVYSNPDYYSTEFDTSHWTDAVTTVHPVLNVTPHLVGAAPGDLATSELRVSTGGGGGVAFWISRHQAGETFHPCIDDVEATAAPVARAYTAGAGAVDLGAMAPADFTVAVDRQLHGFLGYIDRQQGASPLASTEDAQDYVAWTLDSIVTTITFTPVPVRHLFKKPLATPPLRQRQRAAGTGAAAGPPLRQRGTLGDAEPPLRQRGTL